MKYILHNEPWIGLDKEVVKKEYCFVDKCYYPVEEMIEVPLSGEEKNHWINKKNIQAYCNLHGWNEEEKQVIENELKDLANGNIK